MKKIIKLLVGSLLLFSTIIYTACEDYLDIVPDNIATIDNAFTSRAMAEKFLFTCYSYMPTHANIDNQSFTIGDEFWIPWPQTPSYFYNSLFEGIARGNQSVVNPMMNYWDGDKSMFTALRDCNLFLERINDVPGINLIEKSRWIAEVKFLKAYYHYWLVRMYGPIPLIKQNLPVSASVEEVQVTRIPVDDCYEYIIELLDEAIKELPVMLEKRTSEMGRVTKPIAMAVKAKVLVEAASPLFNGNTDYASFVRKTDGAQYFNQTFEIKKWEVAALACREVIEICDSLGFRLYEFTPSGGDRVNDTLKIQMSIRNSVADNNYNNNLEIIWTNPNSTSHNLQVRTTPTLDAKYTANAGHRPVLGPPLKIAEMFYTANGIPIDEDEEWLSSGKYANRYSRQTATEKDKYNIKEGEQTAILHFDRENRFYANLAFDRGLWYGIGKNDMDDQWVIRNRVGEPAGKRDLSFYSTTGYYCKKLANYQNNLLEGDGAGYSIIDYPWPVIRLADLYLLYAEALNEAYGPSDEVYSFINKVRDRAGLEGVEDSYTKYAISSRKTKYTTQAGLREIIQRERLIELANEGHRYWEIRRWKKAKEVWHNQPIRGWDVDQEDAETYYRVKTIFVQQFTTKNYLWPIREYNLSVNLKLDQNPMW